MNDLKRKSKIDYKKLNENKRFCNDDLIHDIVDKHQIKEDLVREIIEAQSKFAAKIIKSGGLQTIILPYLGKLRVNPYHVQKLMAKSMKG